MIRTALAFFVLASAALPAAAQQGLPSTEVMTCAQATAGVARGGSAVLRTGQYTYARFVVHHGFCGPADGVDLIPVRTTDNPQCPLFVCRSGNRPSGGGR